MAKLTLQVLSAYALSAAIMLVVVVALTVKE